MAAKTPRIDDHTAQLLQAGLAMHRAFGAGRAPC